MPSRTGGPGFCCGRQYPIPALLTHCLLGGPPPSLGTSKRTGERQSGASPLPVCSGHGREMEFFNIERLESKQYHTFQSP